MGNSVEALREPGRSVAEVRELALPVTASAVVILLFALLSADVLVVTFPFVTLVLDVVPGVDTMERFDAWPEALLEVRPGTSVLPVDTL